MESATPELAGGAPAEVVLLRYSEIFLKGGNRKLFERQLLRNAQRALAPLAGARVERTHGRLLAWPGPGERERALRALERVFGLVSLSPARVTRRALDAISEAAVAEARAEVARRGGAPSFKVETRRADKRFTPQSPEVSRLVGAAIVSALGLPVDVHRPSLRVGVEVGYEHAFVYSHTRPGPGGLPVGVTGRVELLLSGGIDSPVAGWLALKRGCQLDATYFHSPPYTGGQAVEKVTELARRLAAWQQGDVRLSIVGFTDAQKRLRDASGDGRLAVVLYRRMMLRVAERRARAHGAKGLITGEALGQVASQTLDNLGVIGEAASLPVLRPCLMHDKADTIELARRIGTYETSILPYDDCCALFVPQHPETRARLETVHRLEARLDVEGLIASCLQQVEERVVSP
jgi:thiamine biosynthesis protein ThiI